eukprot:3941142-Rhodomonas_salina.3
MSGTDLAYAAATRRGAVFKEREGGDNGEVERQVATAYAAMRCAVLRCWLRYRALREAVLGGSVLRALRCDGWH